MFWYRLIRYIERVGLMLITRDTDIEYTLVCVCKRERERGGAKGRARQGEDGALRPRIYLAAWTVAVTLVTHILLPTTM